ncbi:MAG: GNAT family N-acetyltransferase [Oscillospiraceae bacterium]|nr:GNAT family N-acetyltransferase [Oscillospiraceae bacterium]
MEDYKIEIKTVAQGDAEFLYLLMNKDAILERLNEVPTTLDDWAEAIKIWEGDSDEENYIVWLNGGRIGWFSFNNLQSADKVAYLKMAVLLPEYQHRGIGTAVLRRLLEDLKDRGYSTVMLYTNADNVNAQKCYQKCGFTVVEEFRDVMADGSCVGRYNMRCEM